MFRLYGQRGCSHCAEAEQYLRENLIPAELYVVGNDPIILAGIKQVTGLEQAPVPVLVSFVPGNEGIVAGFEREKYAKLADAYRSYVGANAPSLFGAAGEPLRAAPTVVEEQVPVN